VQKFTLVCRWRGLGSSATAIVGGLIGANHLERLDQNEVIELAISLEGHPDNVVPAMLGMPSRCYGFNKRSAEAQRTQKEEGFW